MTNRRRRAITAAALLSAQRRPLTCQTFTDPHRSDATHEVRGLILDLHQQLESGTKGVDWVLGAPTGDEQPTTLGLAPGGFDREQRFARGMIFLDSGNGRVTAARWFFGPRPWPR